MPFVSVIAPVYNAERTIHSLIRSLKALDYPRDRFELILVDNGSTDKTLAILEELKMPYQKEWKIQSSYAARNWGIKAAQGKLLAFIDADCEVPPEWLARAIPKFSDPTIGCVACEITGPAPSSPLESYLVGNRVLSPSRTLKHPFLPHPQIGGVIYRRDVFDRVGYFEAWVSSADADLAWRMQRLTDYRIHFEPSIVVLHHHRPTTWKYFKQRFKWAYGSVVLYKKYQEFMPYDWKRSLWESKQLVLRIGRWPKVWWLSRKQEQAALCPPWKWDFYEIVTGLANRAGRLYGSIRHGVWYV